MEYRQQPKTLKGNPSPLGAIFSKEGVNFSLFSEHATGLILGLFVHGKSTPEFEIPLDPNENRTGEIWHIFIKDLSPDYLYAYRIEGPENEGNQFNPSIWTADPYTQRLNLGSTWKKEKKLILSQIVPKSSFDWEEDTPLNIPFEKLLIYEMHIRGFTQDMSSRVKNPGTFLGMIEKIPYLKGLGINAVEFLPLFEFDETLHPDKRLCNYWGYSTLNFFSPMARYATSEETAATEFKMLVKALHKAGIEVILDVVYNHTGDLGTFKRIDNQVYYLLDEDHKNADYTGCGNTIQCNHPEVIEFILSSLRFWVKEMHVDGFRFDLAAVFCRGEKGEVLENPPLIQAINSDPILSRTKLIAEAWDCAGLYLVGSFPGKWAEWNGKFRDVVRRFIKGTDGQTPSFASVMCGSEDLYGNDKAPYLSINFITAHDGFTLCDLVSYNKKHNEENGEKNRDGNDTNESWNCGVEGPSKDVEIIHLRNRQMRNLIMALSLSIGTPMFLMGDEYGHTRNGNNNSYCQDNQKNYFLWDSPQKNGEFYHFFQKMIYFRTHQPFFENTSFLTPNDIIWHGHQPNEPDWSESSRFIAYTLQKHSQAIYIAFNAHYESAPIRLPPPPKGKKWKRIVDTYLLSFDIEPPEVDQFYLLPPYSSLLLLARS